MDENTNQTFSARIPPNNIEAEQSVLGAMIFDREAVASAMEILQGDDFYRPDHRAIFDTIGELYYKGIPIDLVTIKDKLTEKDLFTQVGGADYLAYLSGYVYTGAHVSRHIKIVEEKSILRKLIKASSEISGLSYEAKDGVESIVEKAEKLVFDIIQNRHTEEFTHIKDVLYSSFEKIEEIFLSQGKLTGISTGFTDLDSKTAGLQRSDLILIAARPSVGKSAFALNIAQNAAMKEKISTAVFSLEMSKEQLVNRILCCHSLVDIQKLRTGTLDSQDWSNLARSMGTIAEAPIYFDDTPGISITELRAKCRRLKLEKNLGMVIIDYLQLMSGSGRSDSRQQEISEISRSLKAVAREIDAPVIALSQLSRACETRADHRPMLSDLRESGAIEQDADVVAFLYRDEYYNPDTDKKNQVEIIIAKQRNGPTGTVELAWMGKYQKFANLKHSY